MAKPEAEIKKETMGEFVGEVTDTDATTGDKSIKYESTDYESTDLEMNIDREEKKRSWLERCMETGWLEEKEPLWRAIKS